MNSIDVNINAIEEMTKKMNGTNIQAMNYNIQYATLNTMKEIKKNSMLNLNNLRNGVKVNQSLKNIQTLNNQVINLNKKIQAANGKLYKLNNSNGGISYTRNNGVVVPIASKKVRGHVKPRENVRPSNTLFYNLNGQLKRRGTNGSGKKYLPLTNSKFNYNNTYASFNMNGVF